jgi:hypothetical protein
VLGEGGEVIQVVVETQERRLRVVADLLAIKSEGRTVHRQERIDLVSGPQRLLGLNQRNSTFLR